MSHSKALLEAVCFGYRRLCTRPVGMAVGDADRDVDLWPEDTARVFFLEEMSDPAHDVPLRAHTMCAPAERGAPTIEPARAKILRAKIDFLGGSS